MSKKYSVDLKLNIFQKYLQGSTGAELSPRKHDISSESLVTKLISPYKQFGEVGLSHQTTNQQYSLNIKIDIFRFRQETDASYKTLKNLFNIIRYHLLHLFFNL